MWKNQQRCPKHALSKRRYWYYHIPQHRTIVNYDAENQIPTPHSSTQKQGRIRLNHDVKMINRRGNQNKLRKEEIQKQMKVCRCPETRKRDTYQTYDRRNKRRNRSSLKSQRGQEMAGATNNCIGNITLV